MSRYPSMPAHQMRQRQADLEHMPAQWLSAHGNTEGAMWVYDAAAELARLRAVVQAAQRWVAHMEGSRNACMGPAADLIAAVDALEKAAVAGHP